jgi:hypothetical protein
MSEIFEPWMSYFQPPFLGDFYLKSRGFGLKMVGFFKQAFVPVVIFKICKIYIFIFPILLSKWTLNLQHHLIFLCPHVSGGHLDLPLSACPSVRLSVLPSVRPFTFVSHVTQKVFDLDSWNFTGMLISMCSCAPGYFRRDIFSIFRVIALDLVKFGNF